ncbi:uncharacterized protein EV420DRAFT_1645636 [Desarmillaria tabescens]|uniref:Uncharacterized protein n=1 Tax=Armillaria tabescens TaxID=1929756 RepID=A0AA39K3P0_ARMTA|nr:uncharacterized protein EV420DRAFT_1645636 [Desarmillaria tabescens]KAK0452786.1 hypothetical protein EV420DRAFT_1645636 [Desarmillaria tabescens]
MKESQTKNGVSGDYHRLSGNEPRGSGMKELDPTSSSRLYQCGTDLDQTIKDPEATLDHSIKNLEQILDQWIKSPGTTRNEAQDRWGYSCLSPPPNACIKAGGGPLNLPLNSVHGISTALTSNEPHQPSPSAGSTCCVQATANTPLGHTYNAEEPTGDTPGIRLPVDFAILHQFMQSTSGTEGYSGGFTLIDDLDTCFICALPVTEHITGSTGNQGWNLGGATSLFPAGDVHHMGGQSEDYIVQLMGKLHIVAVGPDDGELASPLCIKVPQRQTTSVMVRSGNPGEPRDEAEGRWSPADPMADCCKASGDNPAPHVDPSRKDNPGMATSIIEDTSRKSSIAHKEQAGRTGERDSPFQVHLPFKDSTDGRENPSYLKSLWNSPKYSEVPTNPSGCLHRGERELTSRTVIGAGPLQPMNCDDERKTPIPPASVEYSQGSQWLKPFGAAWTW